MVFLKLSTENDLLFCIQFEIPTCYCMDPIKNMKYFRDNSKDFALKQIEGTGLSMSACREIAVCG